MKTKFLNQQKFEITNLYINVLFAVSKISELTAFEYFLKNLTLELKNINDKYSLLLKNIYIGGVSLSKVSNKELEKLLNLISAYLTSSIVDFTFECHFSKSFNMETIKILQNYKINRLVWRIKILAKPYYNSEQKIRIIKQAKTLGISNFSLDFIFEVNKCDSSIKNIFLSYLVLLAPHISYEFSNFGQQTDDNWIYNLLKQNKYKNYECFSFCLNHKYQSQMTLAYLKLENWYGIGPKAVSFLKNDNVCLLLTNNIFGDYQKVKVKILSKNDLYLLTLIQALNLKEGLKLTKKHLNIISLLKNSIEKLISNKQLKITTQRLKINHFNQQNIFSVLSEIHNSDKQSN